MPLGRLLIGVGDLQNRFLPEGLADNLHADGQAVGKASRNGNGGQAGDIYGQGTDVAEVHLERVVYLLPYFEGDGGRNARSNSRRISVLTFCAFR